MFAIVGILVVFGAVVGGYLMEKGNIMTWSCCSRPSC